MKSCDLEQFVGNTRQGFPPGLIGEITAMSERPQKITFSALGHVWTHALQRGSKSQILGVQ